LNVQSSLDSFVVVQKHLLRKQGVIERTAARGPISFDLDDETREEVDRLFDLVRHKHARLTGRDPLAPEAADGAREGVGA
jgi:hypothetical protein